MGDFQTEYSSKTSADIVPKPRKQAWAAYVRQRFYGRDVVAHAQRTWGLTEGEAKGAVYGTISQRTADKILAHRNGGIRVELAVAAIAWGLSTHALVSHWMELEERAARDERVRGEAAERRMVALARRLCAPGDGDSAPADR